MWDTLEEISQHWKSFTRTIDLEEKRFGLNDGKTLAIFVLHAQKVNIPINDFSSYHTSSFPVEAHSLQDFQTFSLE